MLTPFDEIKDKLAPYIPENLIFSLPNKWEKIGDVLIVKLPKELEAYSEHVGWAYAETLNCKSVLVDKHGISGIYREPNVEIIYGSKDTETIHRENGIKYKLDPQKVMFSSGNMDERIRMGNISNKDEIVVDLFAGIGYFTLPLAVYSKPVKIYACEINPVSYEYLCENILLNDVSFIVEPLLGDNRDVAPENVADRVIMGYLDDTYKFLPIAFNCLKNRSGIVHYHEVCPNDLLHSRPIERFKKEARKINRRIEILNQKVVKSYAPGVDHIVLDVKIG